jgi:hypothetical protein
LNRKRGPRDAALKRRVLKQLVREVEKRKRPRDSLFAALSYGKMTPEQAELRAKQSGLPPLAPQPRPADFNAMLEAWWTLPMMIAWIAWRSHAEVVEAWDAYRLECNYWRCRKWRTGFSGKVYKGYFLERQQPATVRRLVLTEKHRFVKGTLPSDAISIRDAIAKLRTEGGEGTMQATGVKTDTRERVPIPDYEWRDFEFVEVRGRDVVRFRYDPARGYDDLAFLSQHTMKIWPLPETQRPTGTPETHSGGAGRPTMMHLIKAEYDRQKERGEISGSLRKVADDLAAWAKKEHETLRCPTAGTIANALREKHRQPTK